MLRRTNLSTWLAIAILSITLGSTIVTGKTIYIDREATGVNEGSS